MKRRGLRLTLFVVFLLALGGAAYGVWTFESQMARDREVREFYAQQAARAAVDLADLRAAQQAYVAAGQSASFWSARVTSGARTVRTALDDLGAAATAEPARTAIDQAAAVLKDFDQIDRRAREHLAVNQPLLASDLIFADGLEMLRAVGAHLDDARQAEDAARSASLDALRRQEAYAVAGALGLTLLVTLLLLPAGPRVAPARQTADAEPAAEVPLARDARDDSLGAALDARLSGIPPGPPRGDLGATAELCTDLARVADTKDLPSLLARAARILDASGIVLWIADPAGHELLPSIAHGYPAQTIGRLGCLPRDGDNATAAAFRSGRLQVVASEPGQTGAIIAPLLTLSGCIGVMAAEVRNQAEGDERVRAATSIIAAQLATLVSAGPAAARAPAEPKAEAGR